MKQKLNSILLIDDEEADIYYHKLIIERANISKQVQVANNGLQAIKYLESISQKGKALPELIFVDINMPRMNGWEFMEAFQKLDLPGKENIIVIMLSTSNNPNDIKRANSIQEIKEYRVKSLSQESVNEIVNTYFSGIISIISTLIICN